MHIHIYERIFMGLALAMLVAGLLAVGATMVLGNVHLPSPVQRVDPRALRQTPPFDNPGLRQVAPGQYEAVMVAQVWSFTPNELRVPAGATVRFRIASADVTHGFMIEGTRANLTLIPGQVAEATASFPTPGEYLIICHEYCGIGHHLMYGKVIVE